MTIANVESASHPIPNIIKIHSSNLKMKHAEQMGMEMPDAQYGLKII
jgi:hypothetical protein